MAEGASLPSRAHATFNDNAPRAAAFRNPDAQPLGAGGQLSAQSARREMNAMQRSSSLFSIHSSTV